MAWAAARPALPINDWQPWLAKVRDMFLRRDPLVPKARPDHESFVSGLRDEVMLDSKARSGLREG